ncbi:MAG: hypothetical protein M3Y65_24060 [Pseudomonadota bacterium]|nr:hypothetical protein [Pseudomonadota bacterium]
MFNTAPGNLHYLQLVASTAANGYIDRTGNMVASKLYLLSGTFDSILTSR